MATTTGSSARSKAVTELAIQADTQFDKQEYDQCLASLGRLQEQKEGDSKVKHNACIAK